MTIMNNGYGQALALTAMAAFAALGAIVSGCSEGTPLESERDRMVVMAYLYAGERVDDVRVTSTLALDADTTAAPPINDAAVAIIKDNLRYDLVLSEGDSGYYHYDGTDLDVNAGEAFSIEVDYLGRAATGETTVPDAPVGVAIDGDTMEVAVFDPATFTPGTRPEFNDEALHVTWNNDNAALHYVVVDNVDTAAVEIETGMVFPGGGPGGGDRQPFRFISQPTRRDSFVVTSRSLTHTGIHRVRVFRVNQEYADLYEGRQQDSRDLNEPATNIHDGLGVFTAFNSDSVFFYLKEEED